MESYIGMSKIKRDATVCQLEMLTPTTIKVHLFA